MISSYKHSTPGKQWEWRLKGHLLQIEDLENIIKEEPGILMIICLHRSRFSVLRGG
jgi:hypothetical protein